MCPGVIDTPMVERVTGKSRPREEWERMNPIGRMGRAEEVAATVVWLCSDAASLITGVALPIDGGMTA